MTSMKEKFGPWMFSRIQQETIKFKSWPVEMIPSYTYGETQLNKQETKFWRLMKWKNNKESKSINFFTMENSLRLLFWLSKTITLNFSSTQLTEFSQLSVKMMIKKSVSKMENLWLLKINKTKIFHKLTKKVWSI